MGTNQGTILYIEDNPDNRILIRRVLTAEGYTVVEAENAQQALEYLGKETPDLILMDINIPEIDGYTLTKQLKARPQLQHVPIIAMTANVMKGDMEKALQAGCDGYIPKPIDIDLLPEQIARYIAKSRSVQ
ncbi:MAG TPA: response regulator [Anaerolineales bacterium]|nr:response regulator [Anaerolineales bacterium]